MVSERDLSEIIEGRELLEQVVGGKVKLDKETAKKISKYLVIQQPE